jgi:hypothetical protein
MWTSRPSSTSTRLAASFGTKSDYHSTAVMRALPPRSSLAVQPRPRLNYTLGEQWRIHGAI